jgi:hypothetical protein
LNDSMQSPVGGRSMAPPALSELNSVSRSCFASRDRRRGLGLQSSPQIEDVNISAQSHVIGKVPTNVVRVFVNHDLITVPEPVTAKADIVWGNAEEEAAKPETTRSASLNSEDMAWTKTAPEVSVLPSTIHVKMRIITARFMSDPLSVAVNVRRVGMFRLVFESAVF